MLLFVLLSLFAVGTAFAQRITIAHPPNGYSVRAGSSFIVELDQPNSLPNLKEVAVIIGLNACNTTVCPPCDLLGSILYNGGYNPLLDLSPPGGKPPYQNFSLSIASSFQKGRAQLNIFHVALNGSGPSPFTDTQNITLDIT